MAEFPSTSKNDGNTMNLNQENEPKRAKKIKPQFRPAPDDTKPILQDPILRADPIETEEAVLRLPPFPVPVPVPITKTSFKV